jgi:membrane protein DedA with SNARE-associated domain
VSRITEAILDLPAAQALAVVFAVPALEASAFVGFLFPGEIACLLGGVLAYQGTIPLWAVVTAAILGAIAGDSVGYAVGRTFGDRLLGRLPRRVVKPEHVERARVTIRRLGGKAVFVGRFTAALRVLVPGLCGMARMRYRTFLVWNVAGGIVWAGGSVLLGYLAGASWRTVENRVQTGGSALGLLVVLVGALLLWRRRRRQAREAARASYLADVGSASAGATVPASEAAAPASTLPSRGPLD